MYDTLDGLNYAPGECTRYVAQVLKDVEHSMSISDLVKKKREDINVGDVIVGGFSSHLVTDIAQLPRITIREKEDEEHGDARSFFDRKEKKLLVIPKHVLHRIKCEMKETE